MDNVTKEGQDMVRLDTTLLRRIWFRTLLLVGMFLLLAFFFVPPPIRLIPELTEYAGKRAEDAKKYRENPKDFNFTPLDKSTQDFLDIEHHKVIDEIKLRIEEEDSWFHYKFILIGGTIAIFLGQLGFGEKRNSVTNEPNERLKSIFTAESTYSILVLSCVIALFIDMHIRRHYYAIQQLGLWIANYVEPSYVTPKDVASGFRPWEQFLRSANPSGVLLDSLKRLADSFHQHFMTIFIYLLYSIVLQEICLGFVNNERSQRQKFIVITGFVFVQISALVFTFVAHMMPAALVMQLIPFGSMVNSWQSTLYYLIPLFLIVTLHLPYLFLLRKSAPSQTGQ
jgi:hypothetical protein